MQIIIYIVDAKTYPELCLNIYDTQSPGFSIHASSHHAPHIFGRIDSQGFRAFDTMKGDRNG